MSRWRFILRSLVQHLRTHVSVALGVAAATSVLTGALLVGDSVRGSLRKLTLDRLGNIDQVLVSEHFFRVELADSLTEASGLAEPYPAVAPAILVSSAAAERLGDGQRSRATGIQIVGCDARFWAMDAAGRQPASLPGSNQILLNRPLADELEVSVGDRVTLRLPGAERVPGDSPMGEKADLVRSLPGLQVAGVVEAEGLGRFGLEPQQTTPRNAYVAVEAIQAALEVPGRVNAILVAGTDPGVASPDSARAELDAAFRPSLEDYGLEFRRVRRSFTAGASERTIYDYHSLTTDRMIFAPAVARAVQEAWADRGLQPVFTYLATSLDRAGSDRPGIPYSLVTAVDSLAGIGPLLDEAGRPLAPLGDSEIVLNSWAAADLEAAPGERIRVTYFEPETAHAELRERTEEFALRAVVPLTEPLDPYRRNRPAVFDQPPTLANDPELTPEVEGVTDQESINRWEAPFPVDYSRVRPADDDYWENHRTTPKAFVSLATGQRLWGSRFGAVSSFRLATPGGGEADDGLVEAWADSLRRELVDRLAAVKGQAGFAFQPVKAQGLDASRGTTDFDGLFLALSFFVIVAALLLVALLFRLGIERRAEELGILFAAGFRFRTVAWLLCLEGLVVAAAGSLLGVFVGAGYARLVISLLQTRWVGAITAPFLEFFVRPESLVYGFLGGLAMSLITIVFAVRRARQVPVRELLAGRAGEAVVASYRWPRYVGFLSAALALSAVGLTVYAARQSGMAQAGAFVGAGFLVLVALLLLVRALLRAGGAPRTATGAPGFLGLALRNAARQPGRSAMTIGLMATASFLIASMSAFRAAPTDEGTGGFDLMAETTVPVFADLNTAEGREEVLGDRADVLQGGRVFAMRLQPGEDASCNNLYQARRPEVLGVSRAFIEHFDTAAGPAFAWAGHEPLPDSAPSNPWRLLLSPPAGDGEPVPLVLDVNTARYSLHLGGVGDTYEIAYPAGETVRFRVVGLLGGSVLQGRLLIGEDSLVQRFPEVSGYRFFLIQSPPGRTEDVANTLEDRLSDQGMDVQSTHARLAELLAVQNTYLSTFQSLGALGLLLGTFGLATVQLRNVVERRSELALFRAMGFRPGRLAGMVLLESFGLLLAGILTGGLAATVAVLPHAILGGASLPGRDLLAAFALVLVAGLVSSLLPVWAMLRAPLLPALRGN